MSQPDRAAVWLARGWWLLMPPFAALVARLTFERACAAPYELLPSLTRLPLSAWLLAALYVGAHAWIAAAYGFTVARAGALVPTLASVREIWRGQLLKLLVAGAIVTVEYAPVPMWRAIGQSLPCVARLSAVDAVTPLTPTLSPQAGRGGRQRRPSLSAFVARDVGDRA